MFDLKKTLLFIALINLAKSGTLCQACLSSSLATVDVFIANNKSSWHVEINSFEMGVQNKKNEFLKYTVRMQFVAAATKRGLLMILFMTNQSKVSNWRDFWQF